MAWRFIEGASGIFAIEGCDEGTKKDELPASELLTSGNDLSSLSLFSGLNKGSPEVNPVDFEPLFMEAAASSAAREERIEVSIRADDVEAASLAATAAAAAFLLSSSGVLRGANDKRG